MKEQKWYEEKFTWLFVLRGDDDDDNKQQV